MEADLLAVCVVATALFSVCGIRYWTFLATLVLSLPRQLAGVYLGGTY